MTRQFPRDLFGEFVNEDAQGGESVVTGDAVAAGNKGDERRRELAPGILVGLL